MLQIPMSERKEADDLCQHPMPLHHLEICPSCVLDNGPLLPSCHDVFVFVISNNESR